MNRPLHLRLPHLGLALIGGTLGTGTREAVALAIPPLAGIPVAIFAINILGAFLLGFLLDALVRRGPDEGRRRTVRIMVGTGFMGGFTTYSTLATDAALLIGNGSPGNGIAYGVATVLIGAIATWAGIAAATATHDRRSAHPLQQTEHTPPPRTNTSISTATEADLDAQGGGAQ